MRLDKYLKVSRLIKRRTVANEVCSQGRVFINNNVAKPSTMLNIGDNISIDYSNKTITVKVISIPTGNVSIQQSKDLYEIVEHKQYKLTQ